MGLRQGVYVGFWSPEWLKRALQKAGTQERRTMSQEAIHRLERTFTEEEKRAAQTEEKREEVRP